VATPRRPDSAGIIRPSVRVGSLAGTEAITIAAGGVEATMVPSAGMLGTSLLFRGDEYQALPGGVSGYRAGRTTGMPLLAPWANRLAARRFRAAGISVDMNGLSLHTDGHGLPIHGTVGAHPWEILRLAAGQSAASVVARFDYGAWPELMPAFPFPHEMTMAASVAASFLTVTTSVRPTGRRAVPVSFGFHPYFRLPTGRRAAWRLRLPRRRHLFLDGRGIPTGQSEELGAEDRPFQNRTFDDLFELGRDRTLGVAHGERELRIKLGRGYPFAQVYAPLRHSFVCLEPMTAPTNGLVSGRCPVVPPGGTFTARFTVQWGGGP
jgi:aldose 1-epimerase